MWLLHTETQKLHEFQKMPRYAILSHCWRNEEVLFKDVQHLHLAYEMAGFPKIQCCCIEALKMGHEWVWVDTCCIDKSSSAELSEAINSMFNWYARADVCLVYLDDLDDDNIDDSRGLSANTLSKCRWFSRGWTLQELLAPQQLLFFSKSWTFLGTKHLLLTLLSIVTGIPEPVLSHETPLGSFSIAQRMSWAANRETSRIEDVAYSLMGLFDIHMPIIYGEGSSAFRRLQLEIIRRSNDQTIFAWSPGGLEPCPHPLSSPKQNDHNSTTPLPCVLAIPDYIAEGHTYILAFSPADFRGSGCIESLPVSVKIRSFDESVWGAVRSYSWTHLGLYIRMPIIPMQLSRPEAIPTFLGILSCWNPQEKQQPIYGIVLSPHDTQENLYCTRECSNRKACSFVSTHRIIPITKEYCRDVLSRLAGLQDIYITNEPYPEGFSDIDCRPNSHWESPVRLSVVFADVSVKMLEKFGFACAGQVSQHSRKSPQGWEFQKGPGDGILLQSQLPSSWGHGVASSPEEDVCAHASLSFFNRDTERAFSVVISFSRVSYDPNNPRTSIDVLFHHFEEYVTLGAQGIYDQYVFSRYHTNVGVRGSRHIVCKHHKNAHSLVHLLGFMDCASRGPMVATKDFGDQDVGLTVSTELWQACDYEDSEDIVYYTMLVALSLFERDCGSL